MNSRPSLQRNPVPAVALLPGLIIVVGLSIVSRQIHDLIVIGGANPVSSVIIAIILGMIIGTAFDLPQSLKPGLSFSLKRLLKLAIILLGLGLSFSAVVEAGAASALIIVTCIVIAMTVTYWIGKALNLSHRLAVLIGVGTAICGATAIVATAPAIEAEDADVSYSVATITLFGVVAIFVYPIAGTLLGLSDAQFGTWAGTAINETAQVVAAGFAYSDAAGKIATVVKLTRTAMLAPLVVVLGFFFARGNRTGGARAQINGSAAFPWFILGFLALAVTRTIGDTVFLGTATAVQWGWLLKAASTAAKFLIVMAMASVGLMTDFTMMRRVGLKPFIAGLVAALIMAGVSLFLISVTRI